MRDGRKLRLAVALGAAALALVFAASLTVGTAAVSTADVLAVLTGTRSVSDAARLVVWQVRLPRALASVACGAALAVAGLLLQAALDNDLASPGVMGINAGAGFFTLLAALYVPYVALARQAAAFLGAFAAAALVQAISRKAGGSRTTLVLVGVAVSSLASAGTNVVITLHPEVVADKVAFNLGGLAGVSWGQLAVAAPVVAIGILAAALLAPGIDLLALGDETAHGLGLDVKRWRALAIVAASALAAAAVSVCGLLGFVGLIVPNLIRIVEPARTRAGAGLCVVWGAAFLTLCDLLARVLYFPYELPAGLLLSLLGAPFFIWVLVRRKRGWRS